MKQKLLLLAAILCSATSYGQMKTVEYQYSDNTFSVSQQAKQLSNTTTGRIFYNRLRAFDSFNRASLQPYLSRNEFYRFLEQMDGLPAIAQMNGYGDQVKAVEVFTMNIKNLSRVSNDDDYRYKLYEVSAPMFKVIDESWGSDIVDAVVRESYLRLYDYVGLKQRSGSREYAYISNYLIMDPVKTNESLGQCTYTVKIDEPVLKKDNVEIFFSDLALFKKISQKYNGNLLQGPVPAWQAYKDESNVVRSLLMAYEGKKDIAAYYSYMYNLKEYGNPATVQQNLFKDNKWYVWVFRNGVLYYSYMALPCSGENMLTVYEERPVMGVEDPMADGNSY